MKKSFTTFIAALFIFTCNSSISQNYDYHQGYIFEQNYIKRIPLKKAKQISQSQGAFDQFLSWDWGTENITDSRIERIGDSLVIKFEKSSSLSLRDFSMDPTENSEGDSQQFQYLQSIPGYHIVGVIFGHDQPAFLLIHESGSTMYFVDTY